MEPERKRHLRDLVASVRPTDGPISCARLPRAMSDAARQLPRLTMALAEAICNCRDAVAQSCRGAQAPGQRTAARRLHWVVRRRETSFSLHASLMALTRANVRLYQTTL
jgi:hypothetical protein